MELLITCYACKSASCKRVIGVIPYMPYSRHSEFEPLSVIPFSPCRDVNDGVMELLVTAYACKTSTAREHLLALVAHFHLKVLKKVLVDM